MGRKDNKLGDWINSELPKIASDLESLNDDYYLRENTISLAGKERVKNILFLLRSALFPGVYEKCSISKANVDMLIGNNIREAAIELREVIDRVFDYKCKKDNTECEIDPDSVIISFLEKIPEICDVISKFGFYLTEFSYSNTVKGGNCYVLKNVYSFGSEADELYSRFLELMDDIFQKEEKAKKVLITNYRSPIFDKIYRSFGIIKYAYRISYQEVLNLISFIRLGQDFDIISKENTTILYDIFWNTMPGCFKYSKGLENGKEENVDEERSLYIKEKLKKWVYLNE